MSVKLKLQDMPPAGGYSPINYKRIPAKSYFGGAATIGIYLGVTSVGLVLYSYTYYCRMREEIEMRSARMAILPLLTAEKDRACLKQFRINRDVEADLMKNVPGWTVGTLYGERVYGSLPEDTVVPDISENEFYAHASQSDFWKRFRINQLT